MTLSNEIFVVRSINTHRSAPRYPQRLATIAHKFRADGANGVGLIGLQEVADTTSCGARGGVGGAACFARRLGSAFGENVASSQHTPVGALVGGPWEKLGQKAWKLGVDSWAHLGSRSTRFLLETRVRHVALGRELRFYSTHLSHGDQGTQRKQQSDKLMKIVRQRAAVGELPPLLVGDFNVTNRAPIFKNLSEHFELLKSSGPDLIWMGRKQTFISARGTFRTVSSAIVDLISQNLTDHNSPRVTLATHGYEEMSEQYMVTVKTGNRDKAGTDAVVFLTLSGGNGVKGEFRLDDVRRDDFERGSTSTFTIAEINLGALDRIRLRHDNTGKRPGWYVEEVRIRHGATNAEWVFPCRRWLATSHGGIDFWCAAR